MIIQTGDPHNCNTVLNTILQIHDKKAFNIINISVLDLHIYLCTIQATLNSEKISGNTPKLR